MGRAGWVRWGAGVAGAGRVLERLDCEPRLCGTGLRPSYRHRGAGSGYPRHYSTAPGGAAPAPPRLSSAPTGTGLTFSTGTGSGGTHWEPSAGAPRRAGRGWGRQCLICPRGSVSRTAGSVQFRLGGNLVSGGSPDPGRGSVGAAWPGVSRCIPVPGWGVRSGGHRCRSVPGGSVPSGPE